MFNRYYASAIIALIFILVIFTVFMGAIKNYELLPVLDALGRWPFTGPIAVIVVALIFREPIEAKIKELTSVHRAKGEWLVSFEGKPLLPEQGTVIKTLTYREIKQAFHKIHALKHVSDKEMDAALPDIWINLLRNGVITKEQLDGLVSSQAILEELSKLYAEILERPENAPLLDPSAIASWGSYLYVHGISVDTIEFVKDGLRNSREYKDKHPEMAFQQ